MTKGSSAARQDLRKRRGLSKLEQGYMGFVLVLPWLIGFCIFKLYPFVSSLVYSFTDYDLFRGVQNVVGFQNYIDAFTKAKNVKALKVTFTYAFMTVPLKLIFALFIAYILNFKIKGVGLFRTAYYVPSILGGSVAVVCGCGAEYADIRAHRARLALPRHAAGCGAALSARGRAVFRRGRAAPVRADARRRARVSRRAAAPGGCFPAPAA